MTTKIEKTFYIMREGAVREEARSWPEIEALCKSGRLSRDTLIFFRDEDQWKRAEETELEVIFEVLESRGSPAPEETTDRDALQVEYDEVVREIKGGGEWHLMLQAAEMAKRLDDIKAARAHCQRALDENRYHPRIAKESKRLLPHREWKTLRFLEQAAPFWEDPIALLTYPATGDWRLLAALVLATWALSLIPAGQAIAGVVLFVWGAHVARAAARNETRLPAWQDILRHPKSSLVGPLFGAATLMAQLFLPVILVTQGLLVAGLLEGTALSIVRNSPFLSVILFTVAAFYLPAAIMVMVGFEDGYRRMVNPLNVVGVIISVERDYIYLVTTLILLLGVRLLVGFVPGLIPVFGSLVWAVTGVYVLIVGAYATGRVCARHGELLRHGGSSGIVGPE